MRFLLRFLPKTFCGCVPGVSTDDAIVLLRIVLEQSRWLAEYCIRMIALDLARAFDSLTKQAVRAAFEAWGITSSPFLNFLLSAQNFKFSVEGFRGMPNSPTYQQDEGEGTGAPESLAIFLMVLAWFIVALNRYGRTHAPPHLLREETQRLPVNLMGYMDDLHFLQKHPEIAFIRLNCFHLYGPWCGWARWRCERADPADDGFRATVPAFMVAGLVTLASAPVHVRLGRLLTWLLGRAWLPFNISAQVDVDKSPPPSPGLGVRWRTLLPLPELQLRFSG